MKGKTMRQNLYGRYDEQRDAFREQSRLLKHQMMHELRGIVKELVPAVKAAIHLHMAKTSFALSRLDSAVKSVAHLQSAGHSANAALAYYKEFGQPGQVADCYAILARLKIVQGSPYSAEVDLREALTVLRVSISATEGELRDNLRAAAAE